LTTYSKPLPAPTGPDAEFYAYCSRGELRFQRCSSCGTWRHVPRETCPDCGSTQFEWQPSSGHGYLYTWTDVERPLHPAFNGDAPYAPAVIEMDEGVRIVSQVIDCPPAELSIRMRVAVTFDHANGDGATLPRFRRIDRATQPRRASLDLPSTILYEKSGHIATVTINRPDAMNAITGEMSAAIDDAFDDFTEDENLWVMILTGAGNKAFCAGFDLKEAIPRVLSGDMLGYEDPRKRQFSTVYKPIIAAINGPAIAGGMEMIAGTDLRIAADHATFSLGEVRWGLVPMGGSHIRLPRQLPWAIAMELLLTGEPLSATRALEVGMLNKVLPRDQLMVEAHALAETICKNGPLAVRTAKEIAMRSFDFESGFELERNLASRIFASEDAREGPAAFAERRPPEFKGR
jgi:enoyl-CoA hydratase